MKIKEQTLYFGLPIPFDKNTILYQPTLKEVLMADMVFEELLEPFITLDKRHFEEENLEDFDFFFVQIIMGYIEAIQKYGEIELIDWIESDLSNNLVIKRLINVIKFLFRTEDVKLHITKGIVDELEKNYILINKSYKIDRETYPILKEVVCKIFDTEINIEKKQDEKEVSELDRLFAERKAQFEKTHGKKKEKNKDNMTIFKLINYIIHNKFSQYDYNTIQELTIYQIKNTFKYYQSQETYEMDLQYRSSGQFKMESKGEHWFFDKEE